MSLRPLVVALSIVAASSVAQASGQTTDSAANTLTAAEKKAGWTLLFDGHTVDAWRGYKRPDATESRWKLEEGTLTLPPENGRDTHGQRDIISKETFERIASFSQQMNLARQLPSYEDVVATQFRPLWSSQ